MKNIFTLQSTLVLFVLGMALSTMTVQAQQNSKFGILTYNKAVNISGKQRMLSQKIAKSQVMLKQKEIC